MQAKWAVQPWWWPDGCCSKQSSLGAAHTRDTEQKPIWINWKHPSGQTEVKGWRGVERHAANTRRYNVRQQEGLKYPKYIRLMMELTVRILVITKRSQLCLCGDHQWLIWNVQLMTWSYIPISTVLVVAMKTFTIRAQLEIGDESTKLSKYTDFQRKMLSIGVSVTQSLHKRTQPDDCRQRGWGNWSVRRRIKRSLNQISLNRNCFTSGRGSILLQPAAERGAFVTRSSYMTDDFSPRDKHAPIWKCHAGGCSADCGRRSYDADRFSQQVV